MPSGLRITNYGHLSLQLLVLSPGCSTCYASLGEEMATLLQYSCLENPMDRGAWLAMVHGVAELDTTEVTEHARTPHLARGSCCFSGLDLCAPRTD